MTTKRPPLKPADIHIVVSDSESKKESEMKIFSADGKLLHTLRCLAKGQHEDYRIRKGDTPPGIYRIDHVVITKDSEPWHIKAAFGKYFFDLVGLNSEEEKFHRAGVGIHGGGSASPNPLAANQGLFATQGCIRMLNGDLEKILYPLWQQTVKSKSTIYVTVHQH